MRNFFKGIILLLLQLAFVVLVVFTYQSIRNPKNPASVMQGVLERITPEEKFPTLENPIEKKISWEFQGETYRLSEQLYGSVYAYYKNKPKEYRYFGALDEGWEEKYYAMFLGNEQGNALIAQIAEDIARQGRKKGLGDDGVVELVMSFVQSIPYDDVRAKRILSGSSDVSAQYPYETLFINSGVCSDKSFLAAVMLRSLGYGTALFVYDSENHMAIGIKCADQYSTYSSGYCYAETTNPGNKIGIVPSLDASNKASAVIANFAQDQQQAIRQLGAVKIYAASDGKTYRGIANTYVQQKEMDVLRGDIDALRKKIQGMKNDVGNQQDSIQAMKRTLESYAQSGEIGKYNAMVEKFNALVDENKKSVTEYNKLVNLYNEKVSRYNGLLQK